MTQLFIDKGKSSLVEDEEGVACDEAGDHPGVARGDGRPGDLPRLDRDLPVMVELDRADAEDRLAAIGRAGRCSQRLDLARRGGDEAAADIPAWRRAFRRRLCLRRAAERGAR